ncbi:MAG: glycosyltransferase family 39 protein, partial [Cyclobacteriaceae bacterium]|nr:glycosyltransferase family 39 protein [Cyclobacteriaceae bacterium]
MMLKNRTFDINYGILAMLGAFFFLPFLGAVHLFDWDEINFAESAREMIVTGDYLRVRIDYEPFWEKPPFFFWLQVLSMKLFGINEYAARLPNALTGIATLLVLYSLGKKQHGPQFGWLWAVIYGGGILPHFYFKSGIIDPVFNLFIFLSVYFLYRATEEKAGSLKYAVAAGLFNGLAVLTKGPVGFLLMFLAWVVVMAMGRFKALPSWKDILGFAVPFVVVTFFWYGFEVINNGPWFLVEFIKYQIELFSQPVAGHQQPLYYHFIVVF